MKANFILGKKQIILASLVVILGAAVYLNWQFADKSGDLDITNQVAGTASQADEPANAEPENPQPQNTALTGEQEKESETLLMSADGEDESASTAAQPTGEDTPNADLEPTTAEEDATAADSTDQDEPKMLGDAQLVDSKSIVNETYFAMAKLSRTKSRDTAIETISTILDGEQLTEADKQLANEKAIAMTDIIEAESRIENLIKAKGFEECIVYITDSSANVVVKSDGLTQDEATQIKNIVVSEGKIKGETVSITEIQ